MRNKNASFLLGQGAGYHGSEEIDEAENGVNHVCRREKIFTSQVGLTQTMYVTKPLFCRPELARLDLDIDVGRGGEGH